MTKEVFQIVTRTFRDKTLPKDEIEARSIGNANRLPSKNTVSYSQRNLINAALVHLALERAEACVLPVPDTDPPLYVAVGPAPAIARLLPVAAGHQRGPLELVEVEHDDSEGGHHD